MKKLLKLLSILTAGASVIMIAGGSWGIFFTYQSVAAERITTSSDASIPDTRVRGPFTLRSQADVMRKHTLRITEGKTFTETPRRIPQVDENGNPVIDKNSEPVMVDNPNWDLWVRGTALITALNLAFLAYAFSVFVLFLGVIHLAASSLLYALSKKA